MSDLRDRLAEAYKTSITAAHSGALVTIHVGTDVYKALGEMVEDVPPYLRPQAFGWGVSIINETAWEPDAIEVQTRQAIL